MITKEFIEFKNYGKCIKLSNGIIEAVATLDLGPRIVFFGFIGEENIMNTQKDEFDPVFDENFDKHFYKARAKIFSILQKYGLDTATVAAALASCGVAIGLALQGSLSNFAGGVLILVLKPFVVGDYIVEDSNKCEGTVKEIQMFYTKLQTPDNRTIIIPNGTLANNSLTNVTAQDKRRIDFTVDIAYDADLKKAKEVIQTVLNQDMGVLADEDKVVYVSALASSSVVLGVRCWVKKEVYWEVRWRLLEDIKLALDENGIEIPFNQLVVHTKEEK